MMQLARSLYAVSYTHLDVYKRQLQRALVRTLPEFENFRVKLRKGFFWYYFETNNRNPGVEEEQSAPCRFIDPHRGARFPFRVSYYCLLYTSVCDIEKKHRHRCTLGIFLCLIL